MSIDSAPIRIGFWFPGSQIQMLSPIAASSTANVRTGTTTRWIARPRIRPPMSTTIEPPSSAKSGESAL